MFPVEQWLPHPATRDLSHIVSSLEGLVRSLSSAGAHRQRAEYDRLRDAVRRVSARLDEVFTDASSSDEEDCPPPDHSTVPGDASGRKEIGHDARERIRALDERILAYPESGLLYARRAQETEPFEGMDDETLADCNTSLTLNPNCALALRTRARLHARRHDWAAAVVDMTRHQNVDYDPAFDADLVAWKRDRATAGPRDESRPAPTPSLPNASPFASAPSMPSELDLKTIMSDPRFIQMAQSMFSAFQNPSSART